MISSCSVCVLESCLPVHRCSGATLGEFKAHLLRLLPGIEIKRILFSGKSLSDGTSAVTVFATGRDSMIVVVAINKSGLSAACRFIPDLWLVTICG